MYHTFWRIAAIVISLILAVSVFALLSAPVDSDFDFISSSSKDTQSPSTSMSLSASVCGEARFLNDASCDALLKTEHDYQRTYFDMQYTGVFFAVLILELLNKISKTITKKFKLLI